MEILVNQGIVEGQTVDREIGEGRQTIHDVTKTTTLPSQD